MGPLLQKLKGRQQQFAILMAQGNITGKEAARQAGYNDGCQRRTASRLMSQQKIADAINEIKEQSVSDAIVKRTKALEELSNIITSDRESSSAKIKAIDTLAKLEGWYAPEKTDNSHRLAEPAKLVFVDKTLQAAKVEAELEK